MTVTQKSVYVKTYGCQMNVYDSERMRAEGHGLRGNPISDLADLVIFSYLHIREHAAEKGLFGTWPDEAPEENRSGGGCWWQWRAAWRKPKGQKYPPGQNR
jgi:tRNA A37 methylthiotransferase MiaB